MSDLFSNVYNPDVLSCLANLSNDEVFTPPEVVNKMLDMLPQELFSNPDTTFLDPACKSGVFLREIAVRLIKGLEKQMPDLQERLDHIFHKQLFGIAITELTSLLSRRSVYCSKYPNGDLSVSKFDNAQGNVRFKRINHTWKDGKCVFCGASEDGYARGDELESHAYEFIHTYKAEELFNMKFDVIIGNPPYQLDTGGGNMQAKPIYHKFIEQAKKLKPRYLSMIIPSRWFSGGMGLENFRNDMLTSTTIKKIVDFPKSSDCFSGVDIAGGVCYFLIDKDYDGDCEVVTKTKDSETVAVRRLDEYEFFIRDNTALKIVRKIQKFSSNGLDSVVSPISPFGIPTTYVPVDDGIPCYFTQKIGVKNVKKSYINDSLKIIDKYKFIVPKAPIAGQTDFSKPVGFFYDGNVRIAAPGEVCSMSWLVLNSFNSENEAKSFKSYMLTKVVRFLLLQTVVSQNISKKNYCFIPNLEKYDRNYTDQYLCDLWGITDAEWQYIDSRIHNYGDE